MSINSTGLYTSDTGQGNNVVSATVGAISGSALAANAPAGGTGADGTVTVTPATTYQTMDGFGYSEREWCDPHFNGQSGTATGPSMVISQADKDAIFDLLHHPTIGLGLNRFTAHILWPGYQLADGGAYTPNGTGLWPAGPRADMTIAWCKAALARNPAFQATFQVAKFDTWTVPGTTAVSKLAAIIKNTLDYAKTAGYEPTYVGVQNEPDLVSGFTDTYTRDVIKSLGGLIAADGRYTVKISGPDCSTAASSDAYAATIMADVTARGYMGCLNTHIYGGPDVSGLQAKGVTYGLPVFMSEYDASSDTGDKLVWARNYIHVLLTTYNVAAVDMLNGVFGGITGGVKPYTYIYTLPNASNQFVSYELQPSYYQVGHYSKFVNRGDVRISASATSPSSNVKVVAFKRGTKKTIVLINSSLTTQYSLFIPAGVYRMVQTAWLASDRLAEKGLFSSSVNLPADSITTLIEQ